MRVFGTNVMHVKKAFLGNPIYAFISGVYNRIKFDTIVMKMKRQNLKQSGFTSVTKPFLGSKI